jgi:hypothetical protein
MRNASSSATAKSFDDPHVCCGRAPPFLVAELPDHRIRKRLVLEILTMLEGKIEEVFLLAILDFCVAAASNARSGETARNMIGGERARVGPEQIPRKLIQDNDGREGWSWRRNSKAVVDHEPSVQLQETVANLRVDFFAFGKPVSVPEFFEPEADDVADPGWLIALCNRSRMWHVNPAGRPCASLRPDSPRRRNS